MIHRIPSFTFTTGQTFTDVPVAVETFGALNPAGTNAVVVCHALTGDAHADQWWAPLIGPGKVLDTRRFFVVCMNVIGSPYGTLSPRTVDGESGRTFGGAFPVPTIRDTVRLHRLVLDDLGVKRVQLAIGGSMGGMQVLEWGFERTADGKPLVQALVPIAVGAQHSAWCIAWSEAQRQAIYADPRWRGGDYPAQDPPNAGLSAARMMAMISYRTATVYEERYGRRQMEGSALYEMESYLRYQGEKLVQRFDAACYVRLTQMMDTHAIGEGRGGLEQAACQLTQPTLVIGIDSDILYPPQEQRYLAALLPNATYAELHTPHGHDAFLIEFEQLMGHLTPWMREVVLVGESLEMA